MARQWWVPRSLQRWPSCLCLGCFATCFHTRVQEVIVEDVPASSFAKLQGTGVVLFLLPPAPAVPAPSSVVGFRWLPIPRLLNAIPLSRAAHVCD